MENKANILHLSIDYPPRAIWGMGHSVYDLCQSLSQSYQITIATRFSPPGNSRDKSLVNLVYSDSFWDQKLLINKYQPLDSYVDFELLMSWNLLLAKKIIKYYSSLNTSPEIVHNHNWLTFEAAKAVSTHFNSPLISSMHFLEKQYESTDNKCTMVDYLDILKIESEIFELSSKIIVFNDVTRSLINEKYGFTNNDKIITIPHGINLFEVKNVLQKDKNKTNEINIIFIGRIVPEKGIEYVLRAHQYAKTIYPNLKLTIVGDGYLRPFLEKKYSSDSIKFTGNISKEELYNIYHQMDIFCFPSLTESFGLVTIEAMSFGLAILVAEGKTVAKIIENELTGLSTKLEYGLKTEVNQTDFNEKLITLISDEKNRNKLGSSAQKIAFKMFSVQKEADSTSSLYDKIIRSKS